MKVIKYTKYIYGHLIEITLDEVKLEWCEPDAGELDWSVSTPDNIRNIIIRELENYNMASSFSHEDTKDDIIFDFYQMGVSFRGSWRILELDFRFMEKIVLWNYNNYQEEMLSKELFEKYFGSHDGSHFFEKWEYSFKRNLIEMITYFRGEPQNGQKFCNMLMEQVQKYQTRINKKNHRL